MTTRCQHDGNTIERITAAAETAASRGEWERVDQLYRERARVLLETTVPPEVASRVLTVDRTITEQIRVAQAGLTALMDDAARLRHRLQGLRRWNGALSSDSGTIERHV